jgi:hypothetical protein
MRATRDSAFSALVPRLCGRLVVQFCKVDARMEEDDGRSAQTATLWRKDTRVVCSPTNEAARIRRERENCPDGSLRVPRAPCCRM